MAAYERYGGGPPDLDPMQVNWKVFDGKWNASLCEQFVDYCINKGLGEGNPNEDELQQVANIFWERLSRIRMCIKSNSPKKSETAEAAEVRKAETHSFSLLIARRNTRRTQVNTSGHFIS
jgi:hypothetical protein